MRVAETGRTDHAGILAMDRAATINRLCGTRLAPWEVDQLTDEWMDILEGMARLPQIRETFTARDRMREEFMREHRRKWQQAS